MIKITIKQDSPAAKMMEEFMAEKEAFRKAVEAGKAAEYAESKPERFATPLRSLTPTE